MTSIFQISNPFPSTLNPPPPPPPPSPSTKPNKLLFIARATSVDENESKPTQTKTEEKEPLAASEQSTDQSFENRLANVRLKYRSGTGKKAEKRKSKKTGGSGSSKKSGTVMLPPVPLKEPVNAKGLKVDIGFTPYSEMINGWLAALGLTAVVLVELASGRGLLSYHAPPVLFLQVYTVVAAAVVFIKFEKERISIWPEKSPVAPSESSE